MSAAPVLLAWSALVAIAFIWGRIVAPSHHNLYLGAPPFWSRWRFDPSARIVPALLLGGIGVRFGRDLARTLRWKALLTATALTSWAWAAAMAYVAGPHTLTDPVSIQRFDYLQTAVKITSLHRYLAQFVDKIATYNQHTIGHPPAMVIIEWLMLRFGIASPGWNAILVVSGGVLASLAALIALRELAGEAAARQAAPFIAFVPAVLWWETADAFYAGVSATAIMLLVLASGRTGRRADAYALTGGLLFGLTLFLSYGLAPLLLLPTAVCIARRTARPLLLATIGIVPWFAALAAYGYSWFAGFAATRHEYWIGAASQRPYSYFLFADLAVLGIATGPAAVVAIIRLRDRKIWTLVGGVLAVIALADLSGMSKGEVERIWLPFVPWAMLATATLAPEPRSERAARTWLALQIACTFTLALTIPSLW